MNKPILEACVESLEQAVLAEQCGANRIELCAALETGGLTPDHQTIVSARQSLHIPIMVIIRPRPGDFVYSETELNTMARDILFCKNAGIEGVVLGCLTDEGGIDLAKAGYLASLALPMQVTFHKAIDETKSPLASLGQIMQIQGVTRVLTSGGAETAEEGQTVLKEMVKLAEGKLNVIVAGKVTKDNLRQLHAAIGAKEYHGRRIVF
jgi:copper homeostasis protein